MWTSLSQILWLNIWIMKSMSNSWWNRWTSRYYIKVRITILVTAIGCCLKVLYSGRKTLRIIQKCLVQVKFQFISFSSTCICLRPNLHLPSFSSVGSIHRLWVYLIGMPRRRKEGFHLIKNSITFGGWTMEAFLFWCLPPNFPLKANCIDQPILVRPCCVILFILSLASIKQIMHCYVLWPDSNTEYFTGRKWRVAKVLRKEILRVRRMAAQNNGGASEVPSTMDGTFSYLAVLL